jgi:predicted ABC-type ATPase
MKPKIYIIAAPSGYGKSTLAKKLMLEKGIKNHFEADMFMVDKNGNYEFNPKKLHYCHYRCLEETRLAMINHNDVIVSNTFLREWEAAPYVSMAKQYNFEIEVIHLTEKYSNVHGVPDWKVKEMEDKRELFTLEDLNNYVSRAKF